MVFLDWLDSRTGLRSLVRRMLDEAIPGGARWRYVWGSTLLFVFLVQVVTGVLLMTAYAPSAQTAWSSVWYIQTQMTLGWLIRGLHHVGSQAMVVLLPLHIVQVVIAKAYRAPRECNWWLGMGLLGVVLGLGLTGYLLPWDQKGYWATKVATNILALTPIVGEPLRQVVVGGTEYGHATITRFFTLHVMILPVAFVVLVIGHLALFRRHGVAFSPKDAAQPVGNFRPEQLFRDTAAAAIVLAAVLAVVLYQHYVVGSPLLDAPADPTASDYPARPEWYFLFLFQMLKGFEGPVMEVVGAILVPGFVAALFFLVPLFDKALPPRMAHALVVALTTVTLVGIVRLTWSAVRDDRAPPTAAVEAVFAKQARGAALTVTDHEVLRAREFSQKRVQANKHSHRALELARLRGVPPEGPLQLLRTDFWTRGPALFAAHCASCHRYDGHDGLEGVPSEPATSSDLAGFGSRDWIRALLANPMDGRRFGRMRNPEGEPAHTRMATWIERTLEENEDEADRKKLLENFDAVAAYLADESQRPGLVASTDLVPDESRSASDASEELALRRGREFFVSICNECHGYQGKRSGTTRAPDMYGYASVEWIEHMITDPSHESKYGSTGREPARMPAFRDRLTQNERRMIAQWIFETRNH